MPATKKKLPEFTDDEVKTIQTAARRVWDEIAYDCFEAGGEEIDEMSRSQVLELVCDAGRLEQQIARTDKALAKRVDEALTADYKAFERKLLHPVFPHARYGR